jgi:hypothetical protein
MNASDLVMAQAPVKASDMATKPEKPAGLKEAPRNERRNLDIEYEELKVTATPANPAPPRSEFLRAKGYKDWK